MSRLSKKVRAIKKQAIFKWHPPRRLLFDHIPKCAGTTTRDYLKIHYPENKKYVTDWKNLDLSVKQFKELSERDRFNYHLIMGHRTNELIKFVHPDTMFITILREPVDRAISHFFFVKENPHLPVHKEFFMEFEPQLEDFCSSPIANRMRNFYTAHFTGLSMQEAEADPKGSIEEAYRTIVENYDFIGLQENMLKTMTQLGELANFYHPYKNVIANKTKHRPKHDEVSAVAINRITEANFLDIPLYNKLKHRIANIA